MKPIQFFTLVLFIVFMLHATFGCMSFNRSTIVQATTVAVREACDGMTDEECVRVISSFICPDTDSVKTCLNNYASIRP